MSEPDHSGFAPAHVVPTRRTARLVLRPPNPGDEEPLARIQNQPRVLAALNRADPTSVDQMRATLKQVPVVAAVGVSYSAVIELAVSGTVIGMACLEGVHPSGTASLNVWVDQDRPERGCGREAARGMINWGFEELKLTRILADVVGSNTASFDMLTELGFTPIEIRPRDTPTGKQTITTFSLNRPDDQQHGPPIV
jgi:RimJ/RimL family protein N-acetyltransferase